MINTYADLYPYIVPELSNCPQPIMMQYIDRSVRQFCIESEIWVETLIKNKTQDTILYTINSTWEADIQKVLNLWLRSTEDIANDEYGELQDPYYYQFIPDQTLKLDTDIMPAETVTNGMVLELVIAPLLNAGEVDPFILNKYPEAIISHTLFSLMTMTGKAWANPARASYHLAQYNKILNKAKNFRNLNYTGGPQYIEA